jgi:hypothetical protein
MAKKRTFNLRQLFLAVTCFAVALCLIAPRSWAPSVTHAERSFAPLFFIRFPLASFAIAAGVGILANRLWPALIGAAVTLAVLMLVMFLLSVL